MSSGAEHTSLRSGPLPDAGRLFSALGVTLSALALGFAVLQGGLLAFDTAPSLTLLGTALALLAGAITLLGTLFSGTVLIPPRVVTGSFVLWLALGLVSGQVAEDPVRASMFWWARAGAFGLLFALWPLAARRQAAPVLAAVAIALAVALLALTAKERWHDLPLARARYAADPSLAEIDPTLRPEFEARLAIDQVSGPFVLPNALGALFAMGAAFVWTCGAHAGRSRLGAALLLLGTALAAGLLLTAQKGSALALAIGLGASFAIGRTRRKALIAAPFVLWALLVSALLAAPASWLERLPAGVSFAVRREYASAAYAMVRERPLFGVGVGNYAAHMSRLKPERAEETRFVHNDYLEALVETGPLGLLALLGLWLGLLLAPARARWQGGQTPALDPPDVSRPFASKAVTLLCGLGLALAALLCIPFGAWVRDPWVSIPLAALLPLGVWALQNALSRIEPRALARGAWTAALVFCVQASLDFLHAEPGLLATALGFGLLARGLGAPLPPRRSRSAIAWTILVFGAALVLLVGVLPARIEVQAALERGQAALAEGDLLRAFAAFEEASRRAPEDPAPWLGLARVHEQVWRRTGRAEAWEAARRAYLEAIGARRGLGAIKAKLAELLDAAGDHEQALAWWRRSIEAHPSDPHLRLRFARALAARGRFEEAVFQAKRALTISAGARSRHLRLSPAERREALERSRSARAG